jgi:Protein of unknown function (DUF3558)
MTRRVRSTASLVLVAVALVGCGATGPGPAPSGTPAPPPAPTLSPTVSPSATPAGIDPCSLADARAVAASTGGTVGDPQLDLGNPAVPGCYWPVSDSRIGTGTMRVVVTSTGGTAASFQAVQSTFPSTSSISGVGDRAFFSSEVVQLVLFKDGTTVTLAPTQFVRQGADPSDAEMVKVLTLLGKAVADEL